MLATAKSAAARRRRSAGPARSCGSACVSRCATTTPPCAWFTERLGMLPSDYLCVRRLIESPPLARSPLRSRRSSSSTTTRCSSSSRTRGRAPLVVRDAGPGRRHGRARYPRHGYWSTAASAGTSSAARSSTTGGSFGNWIEHYTDGDVVNQAHRPSRFAGTAEETTQWGCEASARVLHVAGLALAIGRHGIVGAHEPSSDRGIGRPVRRTEDLRMLAGNGRYADDWDVPGAARAVFVRSPHANARIRSIESPRRSPRRRDRGVTGVDLAADALGDIPCVSIPPSVMGGKWFRTPSPPSPATACNASAARSQS